MTEFHWKKPASVPFALEYFGNSGNGEIDLESSLPLYLEEQRIRRAIIYPGKKSKSISDDTNAPADLSYDQNSPGVLKIFGDTLVPGVEYKSVLASFRSTSQELVKQALERYGLPATIHQEYVLCDVIGKCNNSGTDGTNGADRRSQKWSKVCSRVVADTDRPLQLQSFWKPSDGFSRRYELRRKSEICAETPTKDDTSGLNENARKISIAKLRPGAIPFFTPWKNKKFEKFADELNLDGTLSRVQSQWSTKKNECNKVINGLNLDFGISGKFLPSSSSSPLSVQCQDKIAPLIKPFLLTLRCYDVTREKLYYVLSEKTSVSNELESGSDSIFLSAPDTPCKLCLHLQKLSSPRLNVGKQIYNYFAEVECQMPSVVKINGKLIQGKSALHCGDVICIGDHYVFMFKDLTSGNDIPHSLPWIFNSTHDETAYVKPSNGYVSDVPPLALGTSMDDNMSVSTSESNSESSRERFRFAYSKEKEEEMLKSIGAVIRQNYVEFPLAPAYLYSMCIEYACHQFDPHQIHNLMLRTLVVIRESVSELSKALQNNKFNCGLIRSKRNPSLGEDYLKSLVRWMSNCVQLVQFLRSRGHRRRFGRRGLEDDVQSAFYELASGLEEIVVFCFQQSIYTITKALYMLLPAVLDSNPFQEPGGQERRGGIWKIITILDVVAKLTNDQQLHTEVTKQLFMYLFFFCSTSLFNRLFLKDAGVTYYNWSAGVRIRANLGEIEDWATRNGMDEEFGQLFEKLLTAAEFLSTSKTLLLKYDWMSMKSHFHPLNEAQLHRLLSGYHLGGRNFPKMWLPPPEDMHQVMQEDDILLEMAGHPPFLLPQDDGIIDLKQPPDDDDFWAYFKKLHAQYGVVEDDSDSGISPSDTPRVNGIFSKTDLQHSFFRQVSAGSTKRTQHYNNKSNVHSSTRKVTFAPMELDSEPSTPREEPGSARSTSQDSESTNPPPDLMRDHGFVKRRRNHSANDRLDQLITNGHAGPQNQNKEIKRSNVENIRCTSPTPPPLPPRLGRDSNRSSVKLSPRAENQDENANCATGSVDVKQNDKYLDKAADDTSKEDEEMFPRQLLFEVNKQILETQQQRKANSCTGSSSNSSGGVQSPMSPNGEVFSGFTELSPRLQRAPAMTVKIEKGTNGLGLGLIDGLYTPLRMAGIYIRSVVPGSPADNIGHLGVGDRLLCVNGKSIVGADYQSAMKLIKASGDTLTLLVAKGNSSITAKISPAKTEC